MYIHGHFYNMNNERIEVRILTGNDRSREVVIGEGGELDFTDDPVDIESQVNDTFDHVLRHQASVRLLARNFIPELYCTSCKDAVVNIRRGDTCLFAGYIEPKCYSQGYIEKQDEIELSCIDALTALGYFNYRNAGAHGAPSYAGLKSGAGNRTFLEIIREMLDGMTEGLDLFGAGGARYLYDGSKSTTAGAGILDRLAINELLFLGDGEDDVWTQEDVLSEIMRYLNLHVVQTGLDFYIYDWGSAKNDAAITWTEFAGGASTAMPKLTVDIVPDIVEGAETSISVGEVYNQLLLTCSVEDVDALVESPLDNSLIDNAFTGKQKYMVEYSSEGEGENAHSAFRAMLTGGTSDYDKASVTDWYMCVKDNRNWTFGARGADLVSQYCTDNVHQERLPIFLRTRPGCALVSFGKVEMTMSHEDNSPTSKVDMKDYLVLSVNGNGDDSEAGTYPQPGDLLAAVPQAVYNGNTSGGVFSPVDDDTTNYIVFSGNLILNPVMELTGKCSDLKAAAGASDLVWRASTSKTVPCRNNSDGRLYTQEFYKSETPSSQAEIDWGVSGLVPFTGTGPEEYEFRYSAIGESGDTVSKVAVLACMLIIGDKCLVETGKDGMTSDFRWQPYKERNACVNDDEYYAQSFTLGFNPKRGDKLIGTSFPIQNNIDYTLGLDVEGTAVPIRRTDRLSGVVKFMVLGPVNSMWDVITRRHPTWFRHTKWTSTSIPLLAHVSSVFVEKFEVKVFCDNGLVASNSDQDLIYMSDTQEHFINKKDDLKFKITSALTTAERRELGVTGGVMMSTSLDLSTGEGILNIRDNVQDIEAKPEQLYVDSYYREWHAPRIVMTQRFLDKEGGVAGLFNHYRHPSMPDKTFFVQSMNRNLEEGVAELTLKEIEQ